MSTVISARKQSKAPFLIAMVLSAVIALAIAFYLTSTGKADAAEQQAPAAAAATVDAATPEAPAPAH